MSGAVGFWVGLGVGWLSAFLFWLAVFVATEITDEDET